MFFTNTGRGIRDGSVIVKYWRIQVVFLEKGLTPAGFSDVWINAWYKWVIDSLQHIHFQATSKKNLKAGWQENKTAGGQIKMLHYTCTGLVFSQSISESIFNWSLLAYHQFATEVVTLVTLSNRSRSRHTLHTIISLFTETQHFPQDHEYWYQRILTVWLNCFCAGCSNVLIP